MESTTPTLVSSFPPPSVLTSGKNRQVSNFGHVR